MYDPDLRQKIEEALEEINELRESCPPLPVGDWELALELGEDSERGEPICWYYYVRPSVRCLFWLHEFNLESVLENLCGVTERTHVRESALRQTMGSSVLNVRPDLALQTQFWWVTSLDQGDSAADYR